MPKFSLIVVLFHFLLVVLDKNDMNMSSANNMYYNELQLINLATSIRSGLNLLWFAKKCHWNLNSETLWNMR